MTCFVPGLAVQVDFILHGPATAAQIAQDALRQAGTQIAGFVAAFKPVLQTDDAMQTFLQGGVFITPMLFCLWWRRWLRMVDPVVRF